MDALDRRLLDEFQRDFPLEPRPFARLAQAVGVEEDEVVRRYKVLREAGLIARIGATFRPNSVGASTLAAMAVPAERLAETVEIVNGFEEINHNYGRDHRLNLWFVVTAADRARVDAVLAEIERRTGLAVLDLPMERDYYLDLGFPLWT